MVEDTHGPMSGLGQRLRRWITFLYHLMGRLVPKVLSHSDWYGNIGSLPAVIGHECGFVHGKEIQI